MILVGVVGLFLPRLFVAAGTAFRITGGLRANARDRNVNYATAAAFHDALPGSIRVDAIDDATWHDLNMPDVLASVDRTVSQVGRQYLYHVLRTPRLAPEPLARLEALVRELGDNKPSAATARRLLRDLDDPRAAYVVTLLFGSLPEPPRLWWTFPVLTVTSFACLVLVAFVPQTVLLWLAVCAVNVCIQLFYKPRVRTLVSAYHELPTFLRVAHHLGTLPLGACEDERAVLRRGGEQLRRVRRATSWLMFEPGQTNEMASAIYEYVNLLFLFDVNALVFCTRAIRDSRELLRSMFTAMGWIDVAQSVAEWRESVEEWTTPGFTDARKALRAERLRHPLLPHGVANSINVDGQSVLITGSNMSGKTTFVRTVGVAAILAQTLHTVCASAWRAPFMIVRTAMGRTDSLPDGKSHYLAEAESVGDLLRSKAGGQQHLYLLDELFTGTNTTERIAAGAAVLSYLNRDDDIVFIATHDIELLGLLGDTFRPFHFREHVTDDGLDFDYLLQQGPSSSRNAIALLKVLNYPERVMMDAVALVDAPRSGGRIAN